MWLRFRNYAVLVLLFQFLLILAGTILLTNSSRFKDQFEVLLLTTSPAWTVNFFTPFLYAVVVFFLGAILVGVLRAYTVRRKMLDVANQRSLHQIPTPRGGGLVISILALGLFLMLLVVTPASLSPLALVYIVMALFLTMISLYDDWIKALPARIRLGCHSIAALILVASSFMLNPVQITLSLSTIATITVSGVFAAIILMVWIIGFTNIFNFMDGIDGIAATQALLAAVGWSLIFFLEGANTLMLFNVVIAALSAGFLVHNAAPARIFMGDSGSIFLGFTLAGTPLLGFATLKNPILFIVAGMFVFPFIVDGTYTIIKRLRNGENVLEAHRKHIYQQLVLSGQSHGRVTRLYGLLMVVSVTSGLVYYAGDPSAKLTALVVIVIMMTTFVVGAEYLLATKTRFRLTESSNHALTKSGTMSSSQD